MKIIQGLSGMNNNRSPGDIEMVIETFKLEGFISSDLTNIVVTQERQHIVQ